MHIIMISRDQYNSGANTAYVLWFWKFLLQNLVITFVFSVCNHHISLFYQCNNFTYLKELNFSGSFYTGLYSVRFSYSTLDDMIYNYTCTFDIILFSHLILMVNISTISADQYLYCFVLTVTRCTYQWSPTIL